MHLLEFMSVGVHECCQRPGSLLGREWWWLSVPGVGACPCAGGEGGGPLATVTMVTTDSCPELRWLHDRMPVVLRDGDAIRAWLGVDLPSMDHLAPQHSLKGGVEEEGEGACGAQGLATPGTQSQGQPQQQSEGCLSQGLPQGGCGTGHAPVKHDASDVAALVEKVGHGAGLPAHAAQCLHA